MAARERVKTTYWTYIELELQQKGSLQLVVKGSVCCEVIQLLVYVTGFVEYRRY